MTLSLTIQLGMKGTNGINDMEQDAIHGLPQLEEQLIWIDIISLNATGNERKQMCQLNGIGCNSWTSSIGGTSSIGEAIDLE